eukprot:2755258-Prymnesium_polylepis.1
MSARSSRCATAMWPERRATRSASRYIREELCETSSNLRRVRRPPNSERRSDAIAAAAMAFVTASCCDSGSASSDDSPALRGKAGVSMLGALGHRR